MLETSGRDIDLARRRASKELDSRRRSQLGQFMTPTRIADFMASLFQKWPNEAILLDPGAGIGSLTEAFAERFFEKTPTGSELHAHAFEFEPVMLPYLREHFEIIRKRYVNGGRTFDGSIHERDFIAEASYEAGMGGRRYTHAVLNPPYKKLGTGSNHRKMLRQVGIETVNLYTAFLGLVVALMRSGGEVVAIIPRSFCNGTYFRPFRHFLLERVAITHIHVFESRERAFQEDEVLQENIIVRLVRDERQADVTLSTSHDASFTDFRSWTVPFSHVVDPEDRQSFIRVPTTEVSTPNLFDSTLAELNISVSTGPVVDFRVRNDWLTAPKGACAPLLYTHHLRGGILQWPKPHKKPNALRLNEDTRRWLMPRGVYTITKRFSAKEERRRLVAYVIEPESLPFEFYGFENHLNVFHSGGRGLPREIAYGVALFLNSTAADDYFRNFSGHTQVNATDLRGMGFPSKDTLLALGAWSLAHCGASQEDIDAHIDEEYGNEN
jgi:tRNA1(Val) A37 N6-methylase TrmN6